MSDAITAIAAASPTTTQPAPAAQPTAAQTARFEAQLHTPTATDSAYYEGQAVEGAGLGGNWHSVMDGLGQVGQQLRTQLGDLESATSKMDMTALDPQQAAALRVAGEMSDKAIKAQGSMMNFSAITAAGRAVEEGVRTLYQQA